MIAFYSRNCIYTSKIIKVVKNKVVPPVLCPSQANRRDSSDFFVITLFVCTHSA